LATRAVRWRGRHLPVIAVVGAIVALALVATAVADGPLGKDGAPGSGFAGFWLAMLAAGYGEELGWRGLAVPRLLERTDALRTSLLVGALWAAWHWPLFVLYDTFDLGLGGVLPWLGALLCASVVFTWLVISTAGVVAPVMLHAAVNVGAAADGAPIWLIIAINAGVIAVAFGLPRLYGPGLRPDTARQAGDR
jgi:membrane protease YdiL (CAAX protease family)